MSYSCEISFKHINNMQELFSFLTDFKHACIEKIDDVIKDNIIWSPFALGKSSHEEFEKITLPSRDEIKNLKGPDRELLNRKIDQTEEWIKNVFTFRWTYVDKWKLLCVYSVPDQLKNMFEGRVYFQNSCDQNYDLEDWAGIKEFEDIYNEIINMSEEEFRKLFESLNNETLEEYYELDYDENHKDGFIYERKSTVYDLIWQELEASLYNDTDVSFLTIFGSIYDTVIYPTALHAREWASEEYKEFNHK